MGGLSPVLALAVLGLEATLAPACIPPVASVTAAMNTQPLIGTTLADATAAAFSGTARAIPVPSWVFDETRGLLLRDLRRPLPRV
jgi:hypothetical protein